MIQNELDKSIHPLRLGVFTLQLIVITALLWFSDESHSILPHSYCVSYVPDVGQYCRKSGGKDDDNDKKIWVDGLTDNLNKDMKAAYFEMKKKFPKRAWNQVRKDSAEILRHSQNNPSFQCQDNLTAAEKGSPALSCTMKQGGKEVTKNYKNLTTTLFDKYVNKNMLTISEKNQDEIDGHHNKKKSKNKSELGYSPSSHQEKKMRPSAYRNYIKQHVAPKARQIRRSTATVFTTGGEQVLSLEDILQEKDTKFAPSIEQKMKAENKAQTKPNPTPEKK